ncbi:hypothetical protein [Peribacillus simplex]|uniref:Dienelactone hydrolase domain-containing protein n=1 Tax=Peribacillus simplex TaxID=1478 RepID=A0A9W4PIG2_9BACI|nr:hypothetical protein [Peribacillus simplex]MDR4928369.1 hypothetical protein [Peribacillus simplex]WHX92124.1 hypothetical protein QNH50_04425 [Peribacillus simplex]CAH0264484.1 hypothetical protein SRABI133_03485 [Peribacillus simplex]
MEVHQMDIESTIIRMKVSIPENAKGLCIIVPSGQFGKFDEEGAEGELEFYSSLFSALPTLGYGLLQPDMPVRNDRKAPATMEHITEREKVLKNCLNSSIVKKFGWERIVVIGMSLGSQIVLNNLNKPYAGAALIGCVIESEPVNYGLVNNIHLIYGSHDYIAYMGEEGDLLPISPEDYSKTSLKFLEKAGVKNASCTILEGFGHTLAIKEETQEKPVDLFISLLNKWLKKNGKWR